MSGRDNENDPDFNIDFGLQFESDGKGDEVDSPFEEMPEPGPAPSGFGGDPDEEFKDIGGFDGEDPEVAGDGFGSDEDASEYQDEGGEASADGGYDDDPDDPDGDEDHEDPSVAAPAAAGEQKSLVSRMLVPAVSAIALLGVGALGYTTVLPMLGGGSVPTAPVTAQHNPPPPSPTGFPAPSTGMPSGAPRLPPMPSGAGAPTNTPSLPGANPVAGPAPVSAPALPVVQTPGGERTASNAAPVDLPVVPKGPAPVPAMGPSLEAESTAPKAAGSPSEDVRAVVRDSLSDVLDEVRQVSDGVKRFDGLLDRMEAIEKKLEAVSDVDDRLKAIETKIEAVSVLEERLAGLTEKLSEVESEIKRLKGSARAPAAEARRTSSASASAVSVTKPVPAPVRGASLTPPPKPVIIEGYALKGVSRGVAVIQTPTGMTEAKEGTSLPGVGEVRSIRRSGGDWVVVTNTGVIVQ